MASQEEILKAKPIVIRIKSDSEDFAMMEHLSNNKLHSDTEFKVIEIDELHTTSMNIRIKYSSSNKKRWIKNENVILLDDMDSPKTKVASLCLNRCSCYNPDLVISSTSFGYSSGDTFQFCRTCGNER